jgi:hypothetical protein
MHLYVLYVFTLKSYKICVTLLYRGNIVLLIDFDLVVKNGANSKSWAESFLKDQLLLVFFQYYRDSTTRVFTFIFSLNDFSCPNGMV